MKKGSKIRIIVEVDWSCKMANVRIDQRHKQLPKDLLNAGMMGNFWDFHPGCHAITDYGDFNSYSGLVSGIKNKIYELGHEPVVDENYNWRY